MGSEVKTTVYRVQPTGARLHAKKSTTSMDTTIQGVFVFGSFGAIDVSEWSGVRGPVELVKISCNGKDLWDPGDAQGYALRAGKGKIADRVAFKSLRCLKEWVQEVQKQGLTW